MLCILGEQAHKTDGASARMSRLWFYAEAGWDLGGAIARIEQRQHHWGYAV